MGDKHGIWYCRVLHQWKVFLPRQGITFTTDNILVDITFIDPIWQA